MHISPRSHEFMCPPLRRRRRRRPVVRARRVTRGQAISGIKALLPLFKEINENLQAYLQKKGIETEK